MIEIINSFSSKKKALCAFNIQNIVQLKALAKCAQKYSVPVICQFSAKYVTYLEKLYGLKWVVQNFKSELLFFHLDHCLDEELIKFCVDCGFDSVMFDGSSLPLKDNIHITNKIHKYASERGTLLEVELGAIKGVEDGFEGNANLSYYSPEELITFKKSASFDLLALAVGNAHGFYTSLEEIRIEYFKKASELIGKTFFVLHGGTGMPDDMILEAISYGVVKVNISTALKEEYYHIMKTYTEKNTHFDEIKFNELAISNLLIFFHSFLFKYSL